MAMSSSSVPVNWSLYMFNDIFKADKPPLLGTVDALEIEENARKKFEQENNPGAVWLLHPLLAASNHTSTSQAHSSTSSEAQAPAQQTDTIAKRSTDTVSFRV